MVLHVDTPLSTTGVGRLRYCPASALYMVRLAGSQQIFLSRDVLSEAGRSPFIEALSLLWQRNEASAA